VIKITGLKAVKGREKRVKLFLDNGTTLELLTEIALKEDLRSGQDITDDRMTSLEAINGQQRCYNAATRLLAYRPRSESEMRQRLRRRGYDSNCIEKSLAKLKEQGLVDDTDFARFWKENRNTFRPQSRRLTRLELQRKGLEKSIIENVITELDDNDSAYRAASARAKRLPRTDFQAFRRKLGEYLMRKGFGWEVINITVEKVWKEPSGTTGGDNISSRVEPAQR
jgi:regulatory protein